MNGLLTNGSWKTTGPRLCDIAAGQHLFTYAVAGTLQGKLERIAAEVLWGGTCFKASTQFLHVLTCAQAHGMSYS